MQTTDFFRTPERITKLLFHAQSWRGTPWCANSEAKNAGVSCHNLPRALYIETGAFKIDFPRVAGDPNGTKHKKQSVMEPWLDARPELRRLSMTEPRRPGDLLGLRIFHCVDHLAVLLSDNVFIHVLMHKNTDFDLITVPPWSQRLLAAWRPIEI